MKRTLTQSRQTKPRNWRSGFSNKAFYQSFSLNPYFQVRKELLKTHLLEGRGKRKHEKSFPHPQWTRGSRLAVCTAGPSVFTGQRPPTTHTTVWMFGLVLRVNARRTVKTVLSLAFLALRSTVSLIRFGVLARATWKATEALGSLDEQGSGSKAAELATHANGAPR